MTKINENSTVTVNYTGRLEDGHVLQAQTPMGVVNFNVLEVREETVLLDANHPLAGKKLIFDLEVVGIN
jgi:FKBP-type peptidyl-prolyl cis-trans isomerase 2